MELVSFDLIKRIRKHIQRLERMSLLIPSRKKWIGITASIDVLEDSSWAIEYYNENDYPSDMKGKYLYTYGLLQALFVQQDAAENIYKVFFDEKIKWKGEYPKAYDVREMRNDVTGHPLNRDNHFFIYLVQMDMEKESISYLKEDVNSNRRTSVKVNLTESIEDSAKCINHVLERVLEKLDSEHKSYIIAYKDVKMVKIFQGLSYASEKIICQDPVMGDFHYESTKDMVKNCKEEVAKRYGSVESIEAFNSIFKEVDELYDLIDNEVPNSNMSKKDEVSYRLKENLISKLEELEGLCKERDEYFEKEFKSFEAQK
mgnify:CR=1 FL=1